SPGHLSQPEALLAAFQTRAASIARDPTCERAASARSWKFACSERPRRVRANVIRAGQSTPGVMPRMTEPQVTPYATRQRKSSSEKQSSRRANPEGSGRYWWRSGGGRFGGYQANVPGPRRDLRRPVPQETAHADGATNNQKMPLTVPYLPDADTRQ